jgi:dihydroorotate dehydrogenase (fumarate)
MELAHHTTAHTDSFPEALSFFPEPEEYHLGPEEYLAHIRKAKDAVDIPIIASLNGTSLGGWTDYARKIEEAGADALELNIYYVPTDPALTSEQIEDTYLGILKSVKSATRLPVAVKLTPHFTNMANMAHRLDRAGADGLALFTRFYQPDVDLDTLEIRPSIILSAPQALRAPLTWIGILYGRIKADLAATGGIHGAQDALKALMVGAKVTMLCSALLKHGIQHLSAIENGLREWMEEHEYESVAQMQGSLSQQNCPDPSAFERVQYIKSIHSEGPRRLLREAGMGGF